MDSAFTGKGFGAGGFGGGRHGAGQMLTDTVEQLRSMFEQRPGTRAARGDVRAAILTLLAEKPMHGYQLIAEIEQRSGGAWRPSPGSVYPTLQLLVDEGLIDAEASDGRKTYSLTEAGRSEADALGGRGVLGEGSGPRDLLGMGPLPKAGVDLAYAVAQVRRSGTPQQVEQAVAVLDEARRKLYSILAQA